MHESQLAHPSMGPKIRQDRRKDGVVELAGREVPARDDSGIKWEVGSPRIGTSKERTGR